jgi:hypothetical protein
MEIFALLLFYVKGERKDLIKEIMFCKIEKIMIILIVYDFV